MRNRNLKSLRLKRVLLYTATIVLLAIVAHRVFRVPLIDMWRRKDTLFTETMPSPQTTHLDIENAVHLTLSDKDALLDSLPESNGVSPYVVINNNVPFFADDEKMVDPFEVYSDLDTLGRCGTAYANICRELMPTKAREQFLDVKPSGWNQAKYPGIIEKDYLWNRCHLIGFQLAGENSNEKNLFTGTRYLNIVGMLDFENMVAAYVRKMSGHVLYRVTPYFKEDELVARGVLLEAYSVEDSGGLQLCVFCFNIQPGIEIDYGTGASKQRAAA